MQTGMSRFERDSHAGDAVMIAPVSGQIPRKQGIFQGIPEIRALAMLPAGKKRACRSHFLQNSLQELSGKIFFGTGISAG